MRFLLLQARNPDDPAAPHEVEAFTHEAHLGPEDTLVPWDLLQGVPSQADLDAYHCVLVGGSGDFGVGDAARFPWLQNFIDFMGELAASGKPTFASCFGFQALVLAGGGDVQTDKSRAEVGTFDLKLTAEGAEDPLFGQLSETFCAQLGHKDHAMRLPLDAVHLASSERCPYQALRIRDKPVYATQFHPELSMTRNRERFLSYLEAYSTPDMVDPPEVVLANFRDTSGASDLLRRFVHDVLPGALA